MIIISGYLRVESVGHMKKCIFNPNTNYQTVLQNGSFIEQSHKAWEFQLLHILTNTWCSQFVIVAALVVFSLSTRSVMASQWF